MKPTEGSYWKPLTDQLIRLKASEDMLALIKKVEHAARIEIDYCSCPERCVLCEFPAPHHDSDCEFEELWRKYPGLREQDDV